MGKMNQILCCDWLPKHARWGYLARLGLHAVSCRKIFLESHIINPLLTNNLRQKCWEGFSFLSTPSPLFKVEVYRGA